MQTLADRLLSHAAEVLEGTPLTAKQLTHLGDRAAVSRALSSLAKQGKLLRASRGLYVSPVTGKFGVRAPATPKFLEALARKRGETIVPNGAVIANRLGLTTQVPVREIYLTSGNSRKLQLGALVVELRHAPQWQLLFPGRMSGDIIRALVWLGPKHVDQALKHLKFRAPKAAFKEIDSARAQMPTWMAKALRSDE